MGQHRAWIVIVMAMVGTACGKSAPPKPAAADCQAACEHMLDLAMQDIERSAAQAGGVGGDIFADLKAKAVASHDSDLATCQATCMQGKLNTACARAATAIDDVTACTNRSGGLH